MRIPENNLTRPILESVGVLDLNHLFKQLPADTIKKIGKYPGENSGLLGEAILEVRDQAYQHLNRQEYITPGWKHYLCELYDGGFMADVAKTDLVQRLFGIHQLGLNRYSPLPNKHTRGEHEVFLGIDALQTLQALYDHNPRQLLTKLRTDLAGLIPPGANKEAVFTLATKLTALTFFCHDMATPAGGDTIKYLLKLDEEKELKWLLFGDHPSYKSKRDQFYQVLDQWGLDQKHLRFVTDCVQGNSATLIGELINPKGGDKIERDRAGYTRQDNWAASLFGSEIPNILLPDQLCPDDDFCISNRLEAALAALNGYNENRQLIAAVIGLPLFPRTLITSRYFVPPLNIIDESKDYVLDKQSNLVCTRADKLAWTAAVRIWMIGKHYAGPQMLGLESELQGKLRELLAGGKGNSILNRDHLLSITDEQLFQELRDINDPQLTEIIDRDNSIGATSLFAGELVDPNSSVTSDIKYSYKSRLKPGLGTLVSNKGEIVTLDEYVQKNPTMLACKYIMRGLETFNPGKRIDIRQIA